MKDALLWIRKAPSNVMSDLLTNLSVFSIPNIAESLQDLQILMTKNDQNARTPFRSDHDIRYQSIHTTIVAQKVELSKQTSALSEQDLQYSKLVNRVEKFLKDFFETILINPQTLFLREIIIYDLKSPHRDVFTPKPRLAVERALSSPHEYLGCDCCEGLENTLSPLQPTTAILYQLYLESGAVINAADLWSAFHAIVVNEDCEDEDTDQQRALYVIFHRLDCSPTESRICYSNISLTVPSCRAHFLRGLAELKYMGMIKTSRKKVDHLTKLIWKGL